MEHCKTCGGRGWYVEYSPSGEGEQVQCEMCEGTGEAPQRPSADPDAIAADVAEGEQT